MIALPLMVKNLWQRFFFYNCRSKVHVKVKTSSILVSLERASLADYTYQLGSISHTVQKLWPRLKFWDRKVKGHGQGHYVQTFGMIRKDSSQGMYL